MKIKIEKLILFLMLFQAVGISAQQTLEAYIKEALDSNQVIRQNQIRYEQAGLALKTARSMYLPTVQFNGNYTTAQGGRYAELPIGQLLNPVYSTLNQMTASNAFPQISDQQINFLPTNYYDVFLRTALPIWNQDIGYNKRIQEQKMAMTATEQQIYARELVKDVKVAYYQWEAANELKAIYAASRDMLQRQLEWQKAMMAQGKALKANELRAIAALQQAEARMTDAEMMIRNAAAWFNFLRNRPLDTPITRITDQPQAVAPLQNTALNREELNMLKQLEEVQQTVLQMNERYWMPKLSAFADLGSQGIDWEVSNKSAYYMVGVTTTIPIYAGNRNRQQITQSRLDLERTRIEQEKLASQLNLALVQAENAVQKALANREAAKSQLSTADEYLRLVENGYREGLMTQLEWLDAQTQQQQAAIQVALNEQQYRQALAELERANAGYIFK